jgi:hypothetical protein
MALERYGVLIGTLQSHKRDEPDTQGRFFHVNLRVTAPPGTYRCAVDVDSKQLDAGVEWKVLRVDSATLPAAALPTGQHELERLPASGALDYFRHPALAGGEPWIAGSSAQAATALEGILEIGRRIVVFGEPFDRGLGMHNIHQNQGDPPYSQWWEENAIWQDGATLTERPDGALDVFISKFSTQSTQTGDDGHPI